MCDIGVFLGEVGGSFEILTTVPGLAVHIPLEEQRYVRSRGLAMNGDGRRAHIRVSLRISKMQVRLLHGDGSVGIVFDAGETRKRHYLHRPCGLLCVRHRNHQRLQREMLRQRNELFFWPSCLSQRSQNLIPVSERAPPSAKRHRSAVHSARQPLGRGWLVSFPWQAGTTFAERFPGRRGCRASLRENRKLP